MGRDEQPLAVGFPYRWTPALVSEPKGEQEAPRESRIPKTTRGFRAEEVGLPEFGELRFELSPVWPYDGLDLAASNPSLPGELPFHRAKNRAARPDEAAHRPPDSSCLHYPYSNESAAPRTQHECQAAVTVIVPLNLGTVPTVTLRSYSVLIGDLSPFIDLGFELVQGFRRRVSSSRDSSAGLVRPG